MTRGTEPPVWLQSQLRRCITKRIPIATLLPAISPRLAGESNEHIHILAESEASLPPIIVHEPTMRVIDGMHRLRAALLRGDTEIEAQLYTGADDDAFVLGVQANVAHGLPLSLADRRTAAAKIIDTHPHWSDRMIAAIVNLAPKTVGSIRTHSKPERTPTIRLGKDGRARPVSSAAARQRASELLTEHPEASLRQIARTTGLAPSTVHDVRKRLLAGQDPVPSAQHRSTPQPRQPLAARQVGPPLNRATALQSLRSDPSLRLTDAGRTLLRWLDANPTDTGTRTQIVSQLPPHCLDTIAALAHQNAQSWQQFADDLNNLEHSAIKLAR